MHGNKELTAKLLFSFMQPSRLFLIQGGIKGTAFLHISVLHLDCAHNMFENQKEWFKITFHNVKKALAVDFLHHFV